MVQSSYLMITQRTIAKKCISAWPESVGPICNPSKATSKSVGTCRITKPMCIPKTLIIRFSKLMNNKYSQSYWLVISVILSLHLSFSWVGMPWLQRLFYQKKLFRPDVVDALIILHFLNLCKNQCFCNAHLLLLFYKCPTIIPHPLTSHNKFTFNFPLLGSWPFIIWIINDNDGHDLPITALRHWSMIYITNMCTHW